MKRKTAIIGLIISFCVALATLIRLNVAENPRPIEVKLMGILFAFSALTLLYLAYKMLIMHFSKGKLDPADYAVLSDLEHKTYTGEIEFYFTIEKPKHVQFLILNDKMEQILTVEDKAYNGGGHIVRFDSNSLQNGIYFYCIQTPNQKTMKKFLVFHDKLS